MSSHEPLPRTAPRPLLSRLPRPPRVCASLLQISTPTNDHTVNGSLFSTSVGCHCTVGRDTSVNGSTRALPLLFHWGIVLTAAGSLKCMPEPTVGLSFLGLVRKLSAAGSASESSRRAAAQPQPRSPPASMRCPRAGRAMGSELQACGTNARPVVAIESRRSNSVLNEGTDAIGCDECRSQTFCLPRLPGGPPQPEISALKTRPALTWRPRSACRDVSGRSVPRVLALRPLTSCWCGNKALCVAG